MNLCQLCISKSNLLKSGDMYLGVLPGGLKLSQGFYGDPVRAASNQRKLPNHSDVMVFNVFKLSLLDSMFSKSVLHFMCVLISGATHCYADEDFMGVMKALARKTHRILVYSRK